MRSLRTRLVVSIFAVTFVAFGALYVLVAPGLQTRLERGGLQSLARDARRHSDAIGRAVAVSTPRTLLSAIVGRAALDSGDRVSLLLAAETRAGPQFSLEADSSNPGASQVLSYPVFYAAVRTGRLVTGTETTRAGKFGEAAVPVPYQGRTGTVVVFSSSLGDIPGSVSLVQRGMLLAAGIALLIALILAAALARALTARVKRLERAAKQVTAGDFTGSIRVDSSDELGQLASAFNEMQRQLAQLESARKRFIATASHELRTPLFSLGGFVELLEDEDLDPETRRRFLEQVRDQVERLRKLSVDLLDLSKLEAGSLELRPQAVDIGELARSVSGEFEPSLAQHDAHLELRMSPRSMEALCDPARLAQIMRILIDNALVHTLPGSRIVVTAAQDDGRLRVAVRDDGQGIDPESIGRIFEPFFTADDAQGSGLGLAIAGELAERMEGSLSVRSTPGRTIFTLEIPA